ncbi:MAG: hypothetical protein COA57_06730 [Flavobacteriales bacterium]|nr:MAG: hypothetical protein COA57_06730 [Flavobacteriales bacterium]
MGQKLLRDLFILLAAFGAIWSFFYFFPVFPDEEIFEISIENEEQLGELVVEELLGNEPDFAELNNPTLDSALKMICDRLLQQVELTDYDFHIKIVDNEMVNAVTLPGGHIFVFKGLIEFSEHPEEVAAVLAHEIGHVQKRHVVKKLVKELGLAIITGVITGGDPVLITEVSRSALSTFFDRKQESEADRYALKLLEKSNISPTAMAAFFRRLKQQNGINHESLEILSTHPHTNSRIKASLEYKTHEGFEAKKFEFDWDKVRDSLYASNEFESPDE